MKSDSLFKTSKLMFKEKKWLFSINFLCQWQLLNVLWYFIWKIYCFENVIFLPFILCFLLLSAKRNKRTMSIKNCLSKLTLFFVKILHKILGFYLRLTMPRILCSVTKYIQKQMVIYIIKYSSRFGIIKKFVCL